MKEKVNIYRLDRTLDDRGRPTDVRDDFRSGTWLHDITEDVTEVTLTTGEMTTVRGYKAKVRYRKDKLVKDLDLVDFRGLTLTVTGATLYTDDKDRRYRNRYQLLTLRSSE